MVSSTVFSILTLAAAAQASVVPSRTQILTPRASESTTSGHGNILGYIPSLGWISVCIIIYIVIAIGLTWRYFKQRANYMLAMIIGLYFFIGGIGARYPYRNDPENLSLYIAQNTLIVLSPCAFIASIYSILGQLAGRIGGQEYMLISPRRVTLIFVLSDVVTFLIQGGGGGMVTNADLAKIGEKIFLIGLILQLISFILFTFMFVRWIVLVRSRAPSVWNRDIRETWKNDWRTLAVALGISCVCIIIRCFYRVIELSQGFHGELATVEWYFYILDALPLAIATGIFIPFWPELFLPTGVAFNNLPLSSVDSYARAK